MSASSVCHLVAITGNTILIPYIISICLCNSFEDRTPKGFFSGAQSCGLEQMTYGTRLGPGNGLQVDMPHSFMPKRSKLSLKQQREICHWKRMVSNLSHSESDAIWLAFQWIHDVYVIITSCVCWEKSNDIGSKMACTVSFWGYVYFKILVHAKANYLVQYL